MTLFHEKNRLLWCFSVLMNCIIQGKHYLKKKKKISYLYFQSYFLQVLSVNTPLKFVFCYLWFKWLNVSWLIVNLWTSVLNYKMHVSRHGLSIFFICSQALQPGFWMQLPSSSPTGRMARWQRFTLNGPELTVTLQENSLHSCILTIIPCQKLPCITKIINSMRLCQSEAWLMELDVN